MPRPHARLAALALIALLGAPAAAQSSGDGPVREPLETGPEQCSTRAGPYATQRRAWELWRMARAEADRRGPGYGVSRGVAPCWGAYGRGYCFRVFHPC